MIMKKEVLYTTNEVAEMLKVEPLTIRRMVGKGQMKAYKVGRVLRFRQSDIEGFLNGISTLKAEAADNEGARSPNQSARISTARSILKYAGTWAGDDAKEIIKLIEETRSEAEF